MTKIARPTRTRRNIRLYRSESFWKKSPPDLLRFSGLLRLLDYSPENTASRRIPLKHTCPREARFGASDLNHPGLRRIGTENLARVRVHDLLAHIEHGELVPGLEEGIAVVDDQATVSHHLDDFERYADRHHGLGEPCREQALHVRERIAALSARREAAKTHCLARLRLALHRVREDDLAGGDVGYLQVNGHHRVNRCRSGAAAPPSRPFVALDSRLPLTAKPLLRAPNLVIDP